MSCLCFVLLLVSLLFLPVTVTGQRQVDGYGEEGRHFPADCKVSRGGWEYGGTLSTTRSGRTCQRWDSNQPHYNYYSRSTHFPEGNSSRAENYCRNPDYNWPGGAWCYTTDSNKRWEICNVTFCECKALPNGTDYEGRVSRTNSGLQCQRWSSQTPHSHNYTSSSIFPDPTMAHAWRYCRNPSRGTRAQGPWCFTTNSTVVWQYCSVPACDMSTWMFIPVNGSTPAPSTTLPAVTTTIPATTSTSTFSATTTTTSTTTTTRPTTSTSTSRRTTTMRTTRSVRTTTTSATTRSRGDLGSGKLTTTSKLDASSGNTPKTAASSSGSSSARTGGIAGGTVAGILVVIAIGVVVILQRKGVICKQRGNMPDGFDNPTYETPQMPVVTASDLKNENPYVDMSGASRETVQES